MTLLNRLSTHIQRAQKRPLAMYIAPEGCAELVRDVDALSRAQGEALPTGEMRLVGVPIRAFEIMR